MMTCFCHTYSPSASGSAWDTMGQKKLWDDWMLEVTRTKIQTMTTPTPSFVLLAVISSYLNLFPFDFKLVTWEQVSVVPISCHWWMILTTRVRIKHWLVKKEKKRETKVAGPSSPDSSRWVLPLNFMVLMMVWFQERSSPIWWLSSSLWIFY